MIKIKFYLNPIDFNINRYLQYNNLNGTIPESIGKLTELGEL